MNVKQGCRSFLFKSITFYSEIKSVNHEISIFENSNFFINTSETNKHPMQKFNSWNLPPLQLKYICLYIIAYYNYVQSENTIFMLAQLRTPIVEENICEHN